MEQNIAIFNGLAYLSHVNVNVCSYFHVKKFVFIRGGWEFSPNFEKYNGCVCSLKHVSLRALRIDSAFCQDSQMMQGRPVPPSSHLNQKQEWFHLTNWTFFELRSPHPFKSDCRSIYFVKRLMKSTNAFGCVTLDTKQIYCLIF